MEKKALLIAILILSLLLLGVSGLFLYREYAPEPTPAQPARAVIVIGGESAYRIRVEKEDPVLRVAASYLSHLIAQRTGVALPLCGPEATEGRFVSLSLDEEEGPLYSLALDPGDDLRLRFHVRGEALACVYSLCEKWLTESCGMAEDGSLWIDRELIDKQLSALPCSLPGRLRILTQNLRCSNDDGENLIRDRAARLMRLIRAQSPDLIGTQETTAEWFNYFYVALGDEYAFFGASRDGLGTESGERNTIFYRKDRFELVDGDTFWLSDTPGQPSAFSGSSYPRICTWILFRDLATGGLFYYLNTHLDYEVSEKYGEFALLQLEVLFDGMDEVYARCGHYPVFLTGDFNRTPDSETYAFALTRMRDTRSDALADRSAIDYTYHNYGRAQKLLDYCLYQGDDVLVLDYEIVKNGYGGFISDHYGILTDTFWYGFLN